MDKQRPTRKIEGDIKGAIIGDYGKQENLFITLSDLIQSSATREKELRDREFILGKVRAIWIEKKLKPLSRTGASVTLRFHEQWDAVKTPRSMYEMPKSELSLSPKTSIIEVYDDANGELLILGAPGSGKTTQLYELMRGLLDRAQQDKNKPIPVIFHLSSWTLKRQVLTEWLIERLCKEYKVPLNIATSWINDGKVLPLLDGLDEVPQIERVACIKVINNFKRLHPLVHGGREKSMIE